MFVDLSQTFDSVHREKMEQILLEYNLPKDDTLQKHKAMVRLPDDGFDFVTRVLQEDTFTPCFFIICLDDVL